MKKVSTPISPPSGPTQWLFQGPPAESKFLAVERIIYWLRAAVVLSVSGHQGRSKFSGYGHNQDSDEQTQAPKRFGISLVIGLQCAGLVRRGRP